MGITTPSVDANAPDTANASHAANIVAGVSIAGLLIPEAIAYAGIAGLTPDHALIASVCGLVAYACAGSSRYAIVSPTSSSAAVLAASVATLAGTGATAGQSVALASALILLVGVFFLLGAAARMGHLAAFISRPVLRGFALGLAVTIVIKQLPHLAGIAVTGAGPVQILFHLLARASEWNLWTLGTGCLALLCLRLSKRIPMFPAAFAVIVLGVAADRAFNLQEHGVASVGQIDFAHLGVQIPFLSRDIWLSAAELAFPLVVILYAESWGSIRTLALRHNDVVDPNRELAALGFSNFISGLFQGLPVGAGFSASSANEDAGARGRLAGIAAAITIVVLILVAGPWLALLPDPVLAAVVVSALMHALDPRPLLSLWKLGRDEILATSAVLAVIALGVLQGMMLAVLLSLLAAVRRFSQARVSTLGELGDTRDYVDVSRHPEAVAPADILVVRPEAPLFFANAERIMAQIRAGAEARPQAHVLVMSLEESVDLDSTAVEVLLEFNAWMLRSGRLLLLARVKESVRDLLILQAHPKEAIACYWSVADAVAAARLVAITVEPHD